MKSPELSVRGFAFAAALLVGVLPLASQAAQFGSGWTLAGNGRNAVIDVPVVFGTKSAPVANVSDAVTTVWKWDAINLKWAFFSPSLDLEQLAAFATSKGYSVLKTIFPGEGYWVNATKATAITDSTAPAFALGPWSLTSGWNLVATGANLTAPQFSSAIAPFAATTVWAWDSTASNWYFHAPSLDSSALANYVAQNKYLGFGSRTLNPTTGFWVNRAAVQGSPTANLVPLDQAKHMFSELRTTFNSISNSAKTGALDDQVRRMDGDLNGVVLPTAYDVLHRSIALDMGIKLFRDVKRGQAFARPFSTAPGVYFGANVYYDWQNDHEIFPGLNLNSVNRVLGFGYMTCGTNALSGRTSTAVTSVTCFVFGEKFPTAVNSTTTSEPFVRFTITETGTDKYAFQAQGRIRTTVSGTGTSADTGASYSGTVIANTVDANGKVQAFTLAGDIPALTQGTDKVSTNLTIARSLQVAGSPNAIYRYTLTGSLAGVNSLGVSRMSLALETGSYFDLLEDSLGKAQKHGVKELNLVGAMQTTGTRFNGTLNAKAFSVDGDGVGYTPTDVAFTGAISDISAGGSGAILDVKLNAAISNYTAFRSRQALTGSNYRRGSLVLNGTVKLPSRPTMALTLTQTDTGPNTASLSGQYTYDNGLVVTIAGTNDNRVSANDMLSFTNQDGIVYARPGVGNGTITKGGTTLGQVIKDVIYYSDGVFESLK